MKKSDAKRREKLKARRKKAEAHLVRLASTQAKVDEWIAAHDAEPNVIAELVDQNDTALAHIEGNSDTWTVVVGDDPVAGASDVFVALSLFLVAAVDDQVAGNESYIQFSQWLIEEIEVRCEKENIDVESFLRSILPAEKKMLKLPPHRAL